LNIDVRDFDFWHKAAQRKSLHEKIEAIIVSRMVMADTEYVRDQIRMYQDALAELDGVKSARVAETWDEFKRKGKG